MRDRWIVPQSAPPTTRVCRRIYLPDNVEWIIPVIGALSELTKISNWESLGGGVSPQDAANTYAGLFDAFSVDDCMIGVLFPYISDTLPPNAVACSGQTLLRVDYPKLYAKLDAAFIIDADHFKLPDCRARAVFGSSAAAASGLTPKAMNSTGGAETHTLTEAEMPSHQHSFSPPLPPTPTANAGAVPAVNGSGVGFTGATGGGAAHSILSPYVALRWAIWAK